MSWSISTTVKPEGEPNNAVGQMHKAAADRENIGNQQCPRERDEQIDAAVQAVVDLLIGARLIKNADEISVSISGHANKDHAQDDSWSNEFVSVNVSVTSYKAG